MLELIGFDRICRVFVGLIRFLGFIGLCRAY